LAFLAALRGGVASKTTQRARFAPFWVRGVHFFTGRAGSVFYLDRGTQRLCKRRWDDQHRFDIFVEASSFQRAGELGVVLAAETPTLATGNKNGRVLEAKVVASDGDGGFVPGTLELFGVELGAVTA
jgi:hypothetical protein